MAGKSIIKARYIKEALNFKIGFLLIRNKEKNRIFGVCTNKLAYNNLWVITTGEKQW